MVRRTLALVILAVVLGVTGCQCRFSLDINSKPIPPGKSQDTKVPAEISNEKG